MRPGEEELDISQWGANNTQNMTTLQIVWLIMFKLLSICLQTIMFKLYIWLLGVLSTL